MHVVTFDSLNYKKLDNSGEEAMRIAFKTYLLSLNSDEVFSVTHSITYKDTGITKYFRQIYTIILK